MPPLRWRMNEIALIACSQKNLSSYLSLDEEFVLPIDILTQAALKFIRFHPLTFKNQARLQMQENTNFLWRMTFTLLLISLTQ